MATLQSYHEDIKRRLASEKMGLWSAGMMRMAMAYPSPYNIGSSSLGFQRIIGLLRESGVSAERAFLPEDPEGLARRSQTILTYETKSPLGSMPLIGISLSYELEIMGLVRMLKGAGIPPLRRDRGPQHPKILLGGPITFSNPFTAAPFVDAMLIGEADHTIVPAVHAFFDNPKTWLDKISLLDGGYVPERDGLAMPAVAKCPDTMLPAAGHYTSPEAELSDMFLIEGERGCHRQCSFCVMRRGSAGGMRLVTVDKLLSMIPTDHKKVGLVGAAISDHPKLPDLLQSLLDRGHQISLSSLRADRIARKPIIAKLLRESGARTLTVASDAASQQLRRTIMKGTTDAHITRCAEITREYGYHALKVYMMLGLPGEENEDVDELIESTLALSKKSRIVLGIAPFVAKRNTPLDGTPWAGIKVVDDRLKRLKKGLKGRATVRPTSARWAWVEYVMAQHGPLAGEAMATATLKGGRFADVKQALEALPDSDFRPWA
jgi:radical SAM superfamily enzyme YgiQ (UPF0313 family)